MAENQQVSQQFGVQRIYLKDSSFETPMGVELFNKQWQPKINVDLNTKNNKLADDNFQPGWRGCLGKAIGSIPLETQ